MIEASATASSDSRCELRTPASKVLCLPDLLLSTSARRVFHVLSFTSEVRVIYRYLILIRSNNNGILCHSLQGEAGFPGCKILSPVVDDYEYKFV